MIGRAINDVTINGIFGAGGDTMFDMYSLAVCMWCLAIPLAAAGTYYFHWPVVVVYACTITYEQEKYDFTPEEISSYFQEVIEANELDTTPEAFIEDVTGKICLIYKDGGKYYFIHRSFQEYFVAYFFSR